MSTKRFFVLLSSTLPGGLRLWAVVGSNDTKTAVERTILTDKLGADGIQAVTSYYNKPTQAGLVDYYGRIARATDKASYAILRAFAMCRGDRGRYRLRTSSRI